MPSTLNVLVDRFMLCPLPKTVCPDPCASDADSPHRTGTNLLTSSEAAEMLQHVAGDLIARVSELEALTAELDITRQAIEETHSKAESMRGTSDVMRRDAEILIKQADLLRVESFALDRMADAWDQMIEDALHP